MKNRAQGNGFHLVVLLTCLVAITRAIHAAEGAEVKVWVSLANPPPEVCFEPVAPTGRSQLFFVVDATRCGEQINTGDWIGIFDGDVCVGGAEVTTLPMVNPIVAFLEFIPPVGDPLPGAADGDPVMFRICDVSEGTVAPASTTVISGNDPPLFQEGAISAVSLECSDTQGIEMQEGILDWLSFNVELPTADASANFGTLENLVIVQNQSGGAYIPSNVVFPGHPGSDTLTPLEASAGYQLFLGGTNTEIGEFAGCLVEVSSICTDLFAATLNWIPCPFDSPVPIADVFNDTTTPTLWPSLVVIQNEEGGVLIPPDVAFPGHPGTNTIGNMQPGEAYKLFHSSDVPIPFCFPELSGGGGGAKSTLDSQNLLTTGGSKEDKDFSHFLPVAPTGKTQQVFFVDAILDGEPLQAGDEIGVFDGNLCVGAYAVDDPWSYDPAVVYLQYLPPVGDPLPGAAEGNLMSFAAWDASTGDEVGLGVSEVTTGPNPPTFQEGAIAALSLAGEYPSPTPTITETPVPPTPTDTPLPPTVTSTSTDTPVPPTSTSTNTPVPTGTHSPVPPTSTPTPTETSLPPTSTSTATATPVPPTNTPTDTETPLEPTSTWTLTDTPTATHTSTETPVVPTATFTPEDSPTPTPTLDPSAPTPTMTQTPVPKPVVIVATSVNGTTGQEVLVLIHAFNSNSVVDTISLSLEYDPTVVDIRSESIASETGWEIVRMAIIVDLLSGAGTLEVTVRRDGTIPEPIDGEALLSFVFEIVGEDGTQTAVQIGHAVVDGSDDVTDQGESGLIEVSNKPARPSWKQPSFVGEASVGLRWLANEESNLAGYEVGLQNRSGVIVASETKGATETSWIATGLTSAQEYICTLKALNDAGTSAPAELRFTTRIGRSAEIFDALAIMVREWDPSGQGRSRSGIEALVPGSGDLNADNLVDARDLMELVGILSDVGHKRARF